MVSPGRAWAMAARIDSPGCTTCVRASAANAQDNSAQIAAIRLVMSPPGREDRTPRRVAVPSRKAPRASGDRHAFAPRRSGDADRSFVSVRCEHALLATGCGDFQLKE